MFLYFDRVVGYGIIMLFQRIQIPTDVPLRFAFELNGRVLGRVTTGMSA